MARNYYDDHFDPGADREELRERHQKKRESNRPKLIRQDWGERYIGRWKYPGMDEKIMYQEIHKSHADSESCPLIFGIRPG